ncbi:hypothetical protein LCGC14_0540940 [marine sediment metagenome]|uniref:Uncharacterized protein n=1 Tax=marine sediment metagenome TaxID=412755 RepID=A0A0F9UE85_9ZZZZ
MNKDNTKIKEKRFLTNDDEAKGHFHTDWGRQGVVIFAYIAVLLGYFGIVANIILIDDIGYWIPYTEMDPTILIWTWKVYPQTFYLPILLIFLISFLLTYKEDIPHYGIKASLWLVPPLIAEGFLFYWIMFGFSAEPFILQFARGEGYLNILILYGCTFTGALSGMKLKQFIKKRRKF